MNYSNNFTINSSDDDNDKDNDKDNIDDIKDIDTELAVLEEKEETYKEEADDEEETDKEEVDEIFEHSSSHFRQVDRPLPFNYDNHHEYYGEFDNSDITLINEINNFRPNIHNDSEVINNNDGDNDDDSEIVVSRPSDEIFEHLRTHFTEMGTPLSLNRDDMVHFRLPVNNNGNLHIFAQRINHEPPIYEEGMNDEDYARRLQEFYDRENDESNVEIIGRNMLNIINNLSSRLRDIEYEDLLNLGERLGNVSKGISSEELEKLINESYIINDNIEQESCPICQDDFEINKTYVIKLNCKHVYCKDCISTWLKTNKTCPICRKEQSISL